MCPLFQGLPAVRQGIHISFIYNLLTLHGFLTFSLEEVTVMQYTFVERLQSMYGNMIKRLSHNTC